MPKIKLFHSYLYIDKTKNLQIKNNKIYDNNNFICGLLNIPNECDGIKIILERNLLKSKFSKKIINTYYEKNNIKVYIEFDTKYIQNILLQKNIFIKMCEENYVNYVNINQKLLDVVCINKNYNKPLFNTQLLNIHDHNNIKIYDLYLDLKKKTIKGSKSYNNRNIRINFNIIYTDYLLGTIFFINNYNINNICVVCDISVKKLWEQNSKYDVFSLDSFNNLNNCKKYQNIIFCDIDYFKIKKNNFKYILYICSTKHNKTIKEFLEEVYHFSNIQIRQIDQNFKITNQQLYNYSKSLCVLNFFENMLKNQDIQKVIVNNKDSNVLINQLIKKINFNITLNKNSVCNTQNSVCNTPNSVCNICLENMIEDNFLYMDCGHKFCNNCVNKLLDYKLSCSICRSKINSINKNIIFDDLFNNKKWYYIGNILQNFFLNLKNQNNNLIYLEKMDLYMLIVQIIKVIKPNNDYKFLFLDINKNMPKLEIEKNKNINLFYLKSQNMIITSNNLCLYLKNFYKKVKIFEYNIINY